MSYVGNWKACYGRNVIFGGIVEDNSELLVLVVHFGNRSQKYEE